MDEKRIYYCKDCGTLDYASGQCAKCGSRNVVLTEENLNIYDTCNRLNIQISSHAYLYENTCFADS